MPADNGTSKSCIGSHSPTLARRRDGSSSARCHTHSYVFACVCERLQRIDGKVSAGRKGVGRDICTTPEEKNLTYQRSCSRNAGSDPYTERRAARSALSLSRAVIFRINRFAFRREAASSLATIRSALGLLEFC